MRRLVISLILVKLTTISVASERETPPKRIGPQSLTELGILQVSDIESVVFVFESGEKYRINYKDDAELVIRLNKALFEIGPIVSRPPLGDWNRLTLNVKNGTTAWLPFYTEDDKSYIGGTAGSPDLIR